MSDPAYLGVGLRFVDNKNRQKQLYNIRMMDKSAILKRIQANVAQLSAADDARYRYIPLHRRPTPSVERVREVMHLLRAVMFPGFFDEVKEHSLASLPYYIGVYLERIYDLLQEQIYHSLGFEAAEGEGASRGRASDLTVAFIDRIPHIKYLLSTDVKAILDGDPAAKSVSEIIFCYPAISALLHQRVAHELFRLGIPVLPRMMTEMAHSLTGIDIHPGAEIGAYFSIDHGTGVVVGQTAVIGNHVRLYQGVTLGMTGHHGGKRHPTIGNGVVVGANATVLGNIKLADDVKVGAGAVVVRDVPAGATVVGVPAHVINRCPVSEALVLRLFENEDAPASDWSCAL